MPQPLDPTPPPPPSGAAPFPRSLPELDAVIAGMERDIAYRSEIVTQAKAARLGLFLKQHVPLAVSVQVEHSHMSGPWSVYGVRGVFDAAGRPLDVTELQRELDRLAQDLADHEIPDLSWEEGVPLPVADLVALSCPGPGLVATLAAAAGSRVYVAGAPPTVAGDPPAAGAVAGRGGEAGL